MTAITSERIDFDGALGARLAARLDRPRGRARATALFAHCFSCSKDVFAANRIAQGLAARGIAVLRFDFTGLGASDGDFANTNFSSNVGDLVAAARAVGERLGGPDILVGHSLGGAAAIVAAASLPSVKAVATVGAPASAAHVADQFIEHVPEIEARGEAQVRLGGRPFTIRRQFLEDITGQNVEAAAAALHRPLLIAHAPLDATVGISEASRLFVAAKHPKSFLSLDHADHLLTRREDAVYVADVIAAWASRFLGADPLGPVPPPVQGPHGVRVAETGASLYQNRVIAGEHVLLADEPAEVGGEGSGPSPYEFLNAALGACTSMTVRMYAERKGWPLARVDVALTHQKVPRAELPEAAGWSEDAPAAIDVFTRSITLDGDLDAEQRARLLEIAEKCPVHRTLHAPVVVRSTLVV
jgi:putative redox protein